MGTDRQSEHPTHGPDGDAVARRRCPRRRRHGADQEPLSTAEVYQAGAGPLVDLSVDAMSFPAQEVDTTGDALSFTVTNYGTAPLDVSGVETSGRGPFGLPGHECLRPAPGRRCQLQRRGPVLPAVSGVALGHRGGSRQCAPRPARGPVKGNSAGPYVWVPGASMLDPRRSFSATTLADGDVLVAGGENTFENTVNTAELYDPATGSFTATGSLSISRAFSGRRSVPRRLGARGRRADRRPVQRVDSRPAPRSTTRAPGSGHPPASMLAAGEGLTASLLDNGLVLITGFSQSDPELYNPATASWSDTGPAPFTGAEAVVLHDGMVLLTGGPDGASALYDPATNAWSSTRVDDHAPVRRNRNHPDRRRRTGRRRLRQQRQRSARPRPSSTTRPPAPGRRPISLPSGRQGQSAVLLPNGSVLVAGGCSSYCQSSPVTDATYVYADGYWSETGALPASRYGQEATVLPDGDVLLMGGTEGESANATTATDMYIPPLISATAGESGGGPGPSPSSATASTPTRWWS